MTLRNRLVLRYALVAGVCMLLLAGLAHHEFVVEPRVRAEMGYAKPSGSQWGEYAEIVFHALIPLVLGTGWWLMRRTFQPLQEFAARVERVQADSLCREIPRTGNHDEIDRLAEVFNDMMRRLDQAFQHARDFSMHASHELKSALAVLRNDFDTIKRQPMHPECAGCAASRLAEIDRLVRLIDSLSQLAKADVGMSVMEKRPVSLQELIAECREDAQTLGAAHGISVGGEGAGNLTVTGDRNRLRQMLLNLADNAVKYNVPGGSVEILLEREDEFAKVTVVNTGPGITPEALDHVFERFYRGPNGQAHTEDGCGLGLSICQWIAEAHGGIIRIDSKPGGLTTATLRLPLA